MTTKTKHEDAAGLTLAGTDGLLCYDRLDLNLGRSVVVGRSRGCDFSLRRSKTFLTSDEATQRRILADRSFLKVSRRHVRITFLAHDHVEIWNLSRNGTWVDGERIDRILLTRIPPEGVEIRLAGSETLILRRLPSPAAA